MKVQEVAALIEVRKFAYQAVDNLSIKMSREEVKALQNKIPQLDRQILKGIGELDFSPAAEDRCTLPKTLKTGPVKINEDKK